MSIKINAPFDHKEEAKKLGAIWVPYPSNKPAPCASL